MRVGYLINQYPKVSHSFIRREIAAVEECGVAVSRYAIRGWAAGHELVDEQDRAERERTRYVLRGNPLTLLSALAQIAITSPVRLFRAAVCATRLGWRADRPLPIHAAYLIEACLIARWVREDEVGHLHAHFGTNPAEVALLVHVLTGVTWSFTAHGPEEFDRPGALKLTEKVASASFVVAVSSFGRSQIYRWIDFGQWHKVKVVHCTVDKEYFDAAAVSPIAPDRFVCVGRLCEQKGQLLAIEALRRLNDEGRKCELVLVGDGELRGVLEERIRTCGLQDVVRITGWLGNASVMDEILSGRALLLPSFAEGLPVAIMEAMALRRPVISTYVAGIPELVVQRETGWLVAAGDVNGLSEALRACLDATPEALQRMGKAGRQAVLQRHNAASEGAKLAEHFCTATAERKEIGSSVGT